MAFVILDVGRVGKAVLPVGEAGRDGDSVARSRSRRAVRSSADKLSVFVEVDDVGSRCVAAGAARDALMVSLRDLRSSLMRIRSDFCAENAFGRCPSGTLSLSSSSEFVVSDVVCPLESSWLECGPFPDG